MRETIALLAVLPGLAWGQGMDFHSHTYCSDGLKSPETVVEQARDAGLKYFAVTDHDSIACIARAQEAARKAGGPAIIPGIEVSADGGAIHILGLNIDPEQPDMAGLAGGTKAQRIDWMRKVLAALEGMGARLDELDVLLPKWNMERKIDKPDDGLPEEVTAEEVRARGMSADDVLAKIHGYIISPDIAKALVQKGIVRTTQEAFDRFMRENGFANVPFGSLSFPEAIRIIHASGGVAILAHPYTIYNKKFPQTFSGKSYPDFETFANDMLDAGLDGFEVFKPGWERYPADSLKIGNIIAAWRARGGRELLLTPGSDYHGYDFGGIGPKGPGGITGIPDAEMEKLLRAFGHAR